MTSTKSGRDLYDQTHKRRSNTTSAEAPKQNDPTGVARGRALFDSKRSRHSNHDDNHGAGTDA